MIYTGYFSKTKEYEQNGLIPVGISGKIPDGFTGLRYQKLAPKYDWWKRWRDEKLSDQWFKERYYETVLNQLDPFVVVQELQSFGENVVLLCYETPEKFCHRHLVAEWLNNKVGTEIHEFKCKSQPDLFNI